MHPNYKHGHAVNGYSNLYWVWSDMKRRATNPKHSRAKHYYLRGISVCEEWKDFLNFSEWAKGHGYREGLFLDRINNDGDYCPTNCRFITNVENVRNGRNTKINVEIARKIKELLHVGKRQYQIALEMGIGKYIISDIARGKTWRDVNYEPNH